MIFTLLSAFLAAAFARINAEKFLLAYQRTEIPHLAIMVDRGDDRRPPR